MKATTETSMRSPLTRKLAWVAAVVLMWKCSAFASAFVEISSLNSSRFLPTATLLSSGQVLLAGGGGDPIFQDVDSAETYDPATHLWTPTGKMTMPRVAHTATLLQNGKVLVVGGANNDTNLASAELYDPSTRTWSPTGSLSVPRYNQ